jgi:hypothetical protein
MPIDQDFPMSRGQVRALIVGLLVIGGFGAALFGGAIPGLKPNYTAPATVFLNGEKYYVATVSLNWPAPLANYSAPQSFAFHGVSFWLWTTDWGSLSGALVHGNGTEPNGTVFPFVLGESPVAHVQSTLYTSPDRLFAVSWSGGVFGGPMVTVWVHV